MKRQRPRFRLAVRYGLCYLAVFVLPLFVIVCYFYPHQLEQLRNRAMHDLEMQNRQIQTLLETQLDSVYSLPPQLLSNSHLSEYALAQGMYKQIEAVEELKKLAGTNPFLFDLMLYSTRQDTLFTAGNLIPMETYASWRNAYRYRDWPPEEFAAYLRACRKSEILTPMPFELSGVSAVEVVTFVFPLTQYQAERSVLLVLVEEEDLQRLLCVDGYQGMGNTLFADGEGRVITSWQPVEDAFAERLLDEASDDLAGCHLALDGTVLLAASRSLKCGGRYVSYLPVESVQQEAVRLRKEMLAILGALILTGTALILFLTHRNYQPIQRMSRKAEGYLRNARPSDELHAIGTAMEYLATSNDSLHRRMDETLPARCEHHLLRVLSGEIQSVEAFNEQGRELNMSFDYSSWLVAALSGGESTVTEARRVVGEIDRPENVQIYAASTGRHGMLALVSCQSAEKEGEDLLMEVRRRVETQVGTPVRLGLSAPCYAFSDLRLGYEQALSMLDMLEAEEQTRCLSAADLAAKPFSVFEYPTNTFYHLHKAVACCDLEEIDEAVEELCAFLEKPHIPRYFMRTVYRNGMIVLLRPQISNESAMRRYMTALYDDKRDPRKWCEHLRCCRSELCEQLRAETDAQREQTTAQVLRYIEQHHHDFDFSIHTLSQAFGMTASAFSHFFKRNMNLSFKQYMDWLTSEEAKARLLKSDKPLEDIAQELGYGNASGFIRAFRRITGMTPGEYRKYQEREK